MKALFHDYNRTRILYVGMNRNIRFIAFLYDSRLAPLAYLLPISSEKEEWERLNQRTFFLIKWTSERQRCMKKPGAFEWRWVSVCMGVCVCAFLHAWWKKGIIEKAYSLFLFSLLKWNVRCWGIRKNAWRMRRKNKRMKRVSLRYIDS